ncbi:hypothetical protein ACM46_20655 [Chryseobacterium angstadtii]|uniref:Peptidase S74 domain-containing protein n=1 Tax=Chryseobacterium angstadtii TaxID=558151 RepID=A0A0J7I122_9FLAO|nr:tail fiber domain-containing protein [Chryseobacterium angstadtii]KMQ59501.1 hypothetical protein ACM46_20655 [Chryseobacterium angstadtii]
MKRRHYPLLVLMISGSFAFGQVGINTDKPQSTLDVAGNGASAVAKDGIIAPRVTLQQLTAKTAGTYSGSQTGAIVYVTEVTAGTGPSSAQTVEIASTGYYFFDGTLWKKIGGSSASDNIYNTNGTLTGNRVVTQGANTLAFNGNAVNAFSVDGSTFSVDAANNMIGIGTTAPHALLHLDNSVANRKIVLFEQANNDHQYLGFGVNGGLLRYQVDSPGTDHGFFAANGTGASSELMRIKGTGNVGIGTSTPHALLQLDNSVANRKIVLYEQANNDHQYFGFGINGGLLRYQVDGPGTDHVFFAANGAGASNELVRIKGNGNVGIGTASPSQRLHVIGNILASGTITPSDIRIKKDIVDNSYGLKEILALRTINYRYKDEALSKDKKVGFVAQEIKAAMPELVTTANDEMKTLGVNYAEMTVVLTKAVQQQQDMIKKQQVEIDALKAELKEIHKK